MPYHTTPILYFIVPNVFHFCCEKSNVAALLLFQSWCRDKDNVAFTHIPFQQSFAVWYGIYDTHSDTIISFLSHQQIFNDLTRTNDTRWTYTPLVKRRTLVPETQRLIISWCTLNLLKGCNYMFDYREHLHNYKKQFIFNEITFFETYCRCLHRYGLLIY